MPTTPTPAIGEANLRSAESSWGGRWFVRQRLFSGRAAPYCRVSRGTHATTQVTPRALGGVADLRQSWCHP